MDHPPDDDYYSGMNYCIKVSCSDIVIDPESLIMPPSPADDIVQVQIVVRIKHQSSLDPKAPKSVGYQTSQDVTIERCNDLCWPDIIRSLLHFMHIPFSLENERLILRKAEYNIDDLSEELAKFTSRSKKGLVRVRLKITKVVEMQKTELEAWNCFKRYMESEYLEIVHKGPMREMRMWLAVAIELEELRMMNRGRGCMQESCQICLQEFQDCLSTTEDQGRQRKRNVELTRLPCSHMFHEACLQKWFQLNQTCPCCRATAICIPDSYLDLENDIILCFE